MGLSDILSNPALIGMAMAGLSRDREAPMNAMRSIGMVEDINRRREEDARRQQAQVANTGLLQALMQAQSAEGRTMEQAMQDYGQIKTMPSTSQAFMPDQQAGSAVDYETGQSYQPTQVPNQNKTALIQNFYNTLAKQFNRPEIDLNQFQGASPEMMLAVMKQRFENRPADKLMASIEKREKPITLKEGDTLVDPITYQPVGAGANKPENLDRIKAKIVNGDIDIKSLPPEVRQMLGAVPKNEKERASQEKGITKSGWSVYWDPNDNIMKASKTNAAGTPVIEPWSPEKHGQPMQNAMPFNLTVTPPESPSQKADFGMKLRKEFSSLQPVKDYRDVENKAAVMESAYREAKRTGSYVAADQALISLFNKLTDPQSVVRESEYARTGQNLAFMDRMRGWAQKQAQGGAGLTDKDRQTLIGMSKQFLDINKKTYKMYETDYKKFAQIGGVAPDLILFGDSPNYNESQGTSTIPPPAQPKTIRYNAQGQRIP